MTETPRWLTRLRSGFHPTYWVANTLELFERFAFYGTKAVLTVYLAIKVGLGAQAAGSLAGLFSGLIFSLPIVAGVFVDHFGFRKSLMVCFAIFCVGYFSIGVAGLAFGQSIVAVVGKVPYVTSVIILTAIGGSLIKPCIVGTVALTTTPDAKSLGYSIYYTLVNIGGALGPILALQVRENLGIEYVLIMSSATSLFLCAGAYFFYREPAAETVGPKRTFAGVFRDMMLVFRNFRFMSFLVIFSGFYVMFWQIFYSLPFYTQRVLHFERFELLETVDAWGIIFLSVPLSALVKRWSPIAGMSAGFLVASTSWLVIASHASVSAAVVAMVLFAVGEASQAPRFYEYVGDLAPREQLGTFMGFAFLPVAIGSFVAGPLSGWLVHHYLEETMNPSAMWYILAAIGYGSTLLMVGYNVLIARKGVAV